MQPAIKIKHIHEIRAGAFETRIQNAQDPLPNQPTDQRAPDHPLPLLQKVLSKHLHVQFLTGPSIHQTKGNLTNPVSLVLGLVEASEIPQVVRADAKTPFFIIGKLLLSPGLKNNRKVQPSFEKRSQRQSANTV